MRDDIPGLESDLHRHKETDLIHATLTITNKQTGHSGTVPMGAPYPCTSELNIHVHIHVHSKP